LIPGHAWEVSGLTAALKPCSWLTQVYDNFFVPERASLLRKLQRISVKDKKENSDPEWISFWGGPA